MLTPLSFCLLFGFQRWVVKSNIKFSYTDLSSLHNIQLYSYKELQVATGNFNRASKIGEGGFGSVYKVIAYAAFNFTQVLSADSRQGTREFLTELQVIANIQHENLVSLYGCCVEASHRILVYGYLDNNSLAHTLLDGRHGSIELNWLARRKICFGVAQGLRFLHEEVQPHIVHRDIKASNILLDRELTPKISDFGLAKLFPSHLTHISTRVAGTAGYLAPEYAILGQLTRKADIYSFGVLLLEIVSGRPNKERRWLPEDHNLVEMAWQLHGKRKLESLVDTYLNGDYDSEEACRFLKIGLLCTQEKTKLRPSMSTVVQMLRGDCSIEEEKITEPGLLAKLRSNNVEKDKNSSYAGSAGSSYDNDNNTMATSHGTMTFTSINER
ncbi:Cold-responsive protein kinase 1 [Linum perenne]